MSAPRSRLESVRPAPRTRLDYGPRHGVPGMNIGITGSTKGIGLGLAREFLAREHNVMVSSRRSQAVEQVVGELSEAFPGQRVRGCPADVSDLQQVRDLWATAVDELGPINIWVNNAGRENTKAPFFAIPEEDIRGVIDTNLVGLMYCCRTAVAGMYKQGGGWIWNMEGFGSNGMVRPTVSIYGSTKRALRYFTAALAMELEKTPVKVGYLSPGIVITDLLVPSPDQRGERWEQSKKILNRLADDVETVTPFLVEGMLSARENGAAVRWLTRRRIIGRQLTGLFRKRDVFSRHGL